MSTTLPAPLTCALCGKQTRSLYSAPGDTKVKFCSACFFRRGE